MTHDAASAQVDRRRFAYRARLSVCEPWAMAGVCGGPSGSARGLNNRRCPGPVRLGRRLRLVDAATLVRLPSSRVHTLTRQALPAALLTQLRRRSSAALRAAGSSTADTTSGAFVESAWRTHSPWHQRVSLPPSLQTPCGLMWADHWASIVRPGHPKLPRLRQKHGTLSERDVVVEGLARGAEPASGYKEPPPYYLDRMS